MLFLKKGYMTAKKISLVSDIEEKVTDSDVTDRSDIEDIKKTIQAIDWKLWEMYQIAKKFQDYFEIK